MKFWIKIMIPTLLIILLLLNGLILILHQFSYDSFLQNEKVRLEGQATEQANALSEYLRDCFVGDAGSAEEIQAGIEKWRNAKADEIRPLIEKYVKNHPYDKIGIYLRVFKTNLSSTPPESGIKTDLDNPPRYIQYYKYDSLPSRWNLYALESGEMRIGEDNNGGKVACILREMKDCDTYRLLYLYKLDQLDTSWNDQQNMIWMIGITASVVLAVALLLIIRGLTRPVSNLVLATRKLSEGDRSQMLDPMGWDEIAELATLFNTMADETRRLEAEAEDAKRKQRFLDSFTHEMRTPLTNICGYSELMKRVRLSEADRLRYLDYMIHESKRLNRLSQELFNLMVMRGTVTQMELFDCAELCESVRQTVMPKAHEKGVSLICDQVDTAIYGNRALLESLCINLCENAIRACGECDAVHMGFRDDGEHIILRISDTGMGIAPDQLLHITEPFYRVDKARSRAEGGVGLGLYLCSEIVRIHGARMFFDSKEGEGTVVTVRFPRPKSN